MEHDTQEVEKAHPSTVSHDAVMAPLVATDGKYPAAQVQLAVKAF